MSGGHSSSRCAGLSLSRPLPLVEHRLQTRRLSSCGSRAQLLRGMWDPPRPGLEPVSPALAGRFLTTAPQGKPEKFATIVCSNTVFCIDLYLLFFQNSDDTYVRPFYFVPWVSKALFIFISLIFPGCSSWIVSFDLFLSLLTLSSVISVLLLNSSN